MHIVLWQEWRRRHLIYRKFYSVVLRAILPSLILLHKVKDNWKGKTKKPSTYRKMEPFITFKLLNKESFNLIAWRRSSLITKRRSPLISEEETLFLPEEEIFYLPEEGANYLPEEGTFNYLKKSPFAYLKKKPYKHRKKEPGPWLIKYLKNELFIT